MLLEACLVLGCVFSICGCGKHARFAWDCTREFLFSSFWGLVRGGSLRRSRGRNMLEFGFGLPQLFGLKVEG